MKWKNHVAIAKQLAKEFGLSTELEKALCSGSIAPDKRPDAMIKRDKNGRVFIGRAPHHQALTNIIMAHVWDARMAYLSGNDYYAMRCMGKALHYIQDKSVSVGFLGLSHDSREEDIGKLTVPPDAIRRGICSAVPSPLFIKECVNAVRPKKDPYEALYQASLFSAAVFASTIGSAEAEEGYRHEMIAARKRHYHVIVPVACSLTAALIIYGLIFGEPLAIIAGPIGGFLLVRSDLAYYRKKEDSEWFGF